jgi:murein peptide amidase A
MLRRPAICATALVALAFGGPAAPAAGASDSVRVAVWLGRSAEGRPIVALRLGDPDSGRRLLVVGCIHGNEPAGIAVARQLAADPVPADLDVWVLANLNPDGVAAGTRQNGRGVDLNRNFPYRWRPLGPPGSPRFAGPRPLSEPESRLAGALIRRIHPAVTIWFHQALGLVDLSGGRLDLERRYARLIGLPARRLTRYPGSAAGWQNHVQPGSTAFVVELPPGRLSHARARRLAAAALVLGAMTGPLSATERAEGGPAGALAVSLRSETRR